VRQLVIKVLNVLLVYLLRVTYVAASETGWSLVQSSPNGCLCVCVCVIQKLQKEPAYAIFGLQRHRSKKKQRICRLLYFRMWHHGHWEKNTTV